MKLSQYLKQLASEIESGVHTTQHNRKVYRIDDAPPTPASRWGKFQLETWANDEDAAAAEGED